MTNEDLFVHYALSFVGTPYLWGGTSPRLGLDCSGLVRILLHSQGLLLENAPMGAADLFRHFSVDSQSGLVKMGTLIFYANNQGAVDHVAMALNPLQHIEAAGGDASTVSLDIALKQRAFVRLTPIRSTRFAALYPPYSFFTN